MSVLRQNKTLLVLVLFGAVVVLLATAALASPEDLSTGPGDWGGTAGNPDDWGKPQPSGWVNWLIDVLRMVSTFNVYWGAW